jgi:hypothetical protein
MGMSGIIMAGHTVTSGILAGMTMEFGAADIGIMAGITADRDGGGWLEDFGISIPFLCTPILIRTFRPSWWKIRRPPRL